MANNRQSVNPMAGIIAFLFIAMMIWIAVSAVKGVFVILSWLALPLFVIALVLNYRVVTNYIGWIWQTIKKDPLRGSLYGIGSVLGYPFVSAYLAFKAYTSRKFGKGKPKDGTSKGDYIKYEEVEEDDFLELEDLDKLKEKQIEKRSNNEYDDLF